MLLDAIKVGDRIEISNKNDGPSGKFYVSQVEEIIDPAQLVLHVPISYGRLIMLPLDTSYNFLFFTEKGMIKCQAKISNYFTEDGFNMMQVKLLSEAQKVQRREFFRFPSLLPLKFGALAIDYDPKTNSPQPVMYEGVAKDVSGGGVRFVSNYDMEEGVMIRCAMLLGDVYLQSMGKVLHKQEFKKSPYKYQYRVEFHGMPAAEKEKIVQYIFKEQRKALRNEQ